MTERSSECHQRYYRTLVQVEAVSLGEYRPNTIYDIAKDITTGPVAGVWGVKESGTVTREQVQSLVEWKRDTDYRHYKHEKERPQDPSSTYYRTIIEIEVLSKSEYIIDSLALLEYDILSDHCLGVWDIKHTKPLTAKEAKSILQVQNANPMLQFSDDVYEEHTTWSGAVEIDYWNIDQNNYQDKIAHLTNHTKHELVTAIISYHYNAFCKNNADSTDGEDIVHPSGKKIPYIGWYWRTINLCDHVPIGRMDGLTGFIANNKWDYPERCLTDEERMRVISYLDIAISCSNRKAKESTLKELWDYMQTLSIP